VTVGAQQAIGQLLVPDAVLGLLASGIGFLAVTVPESGIDPQRDVPSRRDEPELIDHVGRTAVDVQIVLQHQFERWVIEDVRGVHDRRRIAVRRKPGRQGALDLAGADRVHHTPATSCQIQHGQVRVGFLGVTDGVERLQVGDPLLDLRRVVHVQRRLVTVDQFLDGHAGHFGSQLRKTGGVRHGRNIRERMEKRGIRVVGVYASACGVRGRESFSEEASSIWFVVARKRLPTPFALRATQPNPTVIVLPILSPRVSPSNFILHGESRLFCWQARCAVKNEIGTTDPNNAASVNRAG
jgi:hypothetical protein